MDIEFFTSKQKWTFRFCSWRHDDVSWLVAVKIDNKDSFEAWSHEGQAGHDSVEALIVRIAHYSDEIEHDYDLIDAFLRAAKEGWSYWGIGVPQPLLSTYAAPEFQEQMKKLRNS